MLRQIFLVPTFKQLNPTIFKRNKVTEISQVDSGFTFFYKKLYDYGSAVL